MTRKELLEIKESYRKIACECTASATPYQAITGVCHAIAKEACYNHHERGQRIWAFFQALKEVVEYGTEE